jgi:type IV secretion system protein VirD4
MIEKRDALVSRWTALSCRMALLGACGLVACSAVMIGVRSPPVGLVLLAAMAWRRSRFRLATTSYGSADTATPTQMEGGGLFADHGPILGRVLAERPSLRAAIAALFRPSVGSEAACRIFLAAVFGARWLNSRLIKVNTFVHLVTFSPTGGGKGIAVMIPNLLSYPGNCVVNDPSGTLFRETSEHRSRHFGHRIIRLDPFEVCGPGGDTLNGFDFIDPGAIDFVQQCDDLADRLVIRPNDEKEPHWSESAIDNICAMTAFVLGCEPNPAKRNLDTVRKLTGSRSKYAQAVEIMQKTDACQGVISRKGGSLTWHEGEELGSVQTTLARHLKWLDDPAIARNVATSSFDPAILRTGKATVYLILPHESLSTMSRWLRLQIGTIMRRSTRGYGEQNPVLWLLDEMGHIGRLQVIEDAAGLLRAKGVRLWFVFQSLGQLKTCFGEKAPIILDNVGTQQYFGINSYETAEEISKRIGEATIGVTSINDTTSDSKPTGGDGRQGGSRSRSTSATHSEIARRLWKPEEVLTQPSDQMFIFHKNLPVVLARLVKYYEAREFRGGGTAAPRRLGLGAAILAAFILLAAAAGARFAMNVASLPPSRGLGAPIHRQDGRSQGSTLGDVRQPGNSNRRRPVFGPPPWRRTPPRGGYGPRGYFMRIE